MDIRELKYFLAIAKEENISKASEYLFITQPSLTRQIQNLEKEVGQPLFERKNKKMKLTPAGVLLKTRAEEIISLYEKMCEDIILSDKIGGEINIGGGESYAVSLVADITKITQQNYPDIKFNFFSGNTDAVCEKLDKGLIDFGILIEPADISKYEYIQLPVYDTWGLLMRKDHPLSQNQFITASDLENLPIICSQHSFAKSHVTSSLEISLDKLNIKATYNLLYNASLLVKAGVGAAVCLDKIIDTSSSSELCFVPFKPDIKSRIFIVWKKYQLFSKASQIFLKNLKDNLNI